MVERNVLQQDPAGQSQKNQIEANIEIHKDAIAVQDKLLRELKKNRKIVATDSPWLNEKFPISYKALVLKRGNNRYIAVSFMTIGNKGEDQVNFIISDYFEQGAKISLERSMALKDAAYIDSSKTMTNGNIIEYKFSSDRLSTTKLPEEERTPFLDEIIKSSPDKEMTLKLQRRAPALRFHVANQN